LETGARILAIREDSLAFDQSCFYPGGGGQPPDQGRVRVRSGEVVEVASVHMGLDEILWHVSPSPLSPHFLGQDATLTVDRERRLALARHHTALHVLNTVALRDCGGWITGVQIGVEYSRIDFKIEGFSPSMCAELELKVNSVLQEDRAVRAYVLPEEEFLARKDLLRTLQVKPPVSHGQVRVVEIEGYEAQACGGTHVRRTSEVGRFSIFRTENKGKINKRLYVRLGQGAAPADTPDRPRKGP
jgi:misacylated tRNA(Ala) deacylase